jgi:hypothetical protein
MPANWQAILEIFRISEYLLLAARRQSSAKLLSGLKVTQWGHSAFCLK